MSTAARAGLKSTPKQLSARLRNGDNKENWTYDVADGRAELSGTKALFHAGGTVDDVPFESAFMALGDGSHKLPVKADVRRAIGKEAGDDVTVRLDERI